LFKLVGERCHGGGSAGFVSGKLAQVPILDFGVFL
jgi:hypothetical protein